MISNEKNLFTFHNSPFTLSDYDTNKITITFPEYYLTGSTEMPTQKPDLPQGEYKIEIYQTYTASTPLIKQPINLIQMPFNLTFYHHDHLGTTRYITNEKGEILHTTDTLAYGEELTAPYENDKDEVLNAITYTGHEKDYETDLTYMLARYYSQGYGRFLSPDPGYDYDQLDPMSWNLYAYVRGNPITHLDPTGKDALYLAFVDYKISETIPVINKKVHLSNLGHAAVVIIDKKGRTTFREFGRYYGNMKGKIRRKKVPNVKMNSKTGLPTKKSLKNLFRRIANIEGHNRHPYKGRIEAVYIKNDNPEKMKKTAETPKQEYNTFSYNCGIYAKEVIESGGVQLPLQIDPRPNSYIEELQKDNRFIPIHYDAKTDTLIIDKNKEEK